MLGANPTILPLTDPTILIPLAADAESDGHHMVSRLIAEWSTGSNRFTAPGERADVALAPTGHPIAVAGLSIDPFAHDPTVGRIRRLYVARPHRRRGVASALIRQLSTDAAGHFRCLRLRTDNPQAAAFYEAIGFTRVRGDPQCTHRRPIFA